VKPKIFTSSFRNLEKGVAKRHPFSVLPDATTSHPLSTNNIYDCPKLTRFYTSRRFFFHLKRVLADQLDTQTSAPKMKDLDSRYERLCLLNRTTLAPKVNDFET
jgi:hypothetical protein